MSKPARQLTFADNLSEGDSQPKAPQQETGGFAVSGLFFKALDLTIPVVPIAQPRQRHRVIQMGDKAIATNYTPKGDPVNSYKAALQLAVGAEVKTPFLGPIAACFEFYLPRPKTLMKKSSFAGPIPHTGRPDLDNLIKATKDALKGTAFADDSQVYSYARSAKYYHEKDGQPRVRIVLAVDASKQSAKGA